MNILKTINKLFPWQWKFYTCHWDWSFMLFCWGAVFSGLYGFLINPIAFIVAFGFCAAMVANWFFMPSSLPTMPAPDAVDSVTSSGIISADSLSTSQALSTPTKRG